MHESAFQTASLYINLFKATGIEISNQDIDIAHRIPTRFATSGPRPIVCKFTRRFVKEQESVGQYNRTTVQGHFPFDQKFRNEISSIPCDEWNSIFRLV